MLVAGKPMRSIWCTQSGGAVSIIDQTRLPHELAIDQLTSVSDAAHAISTMAVRGAPLIGATAAYGIALAARADASDKSLAQAAEQLAATRPTARNLKWALENMHAALKEIPVDQRVDVAYQRAHDICEQDIQINQAIATSGLPLIKSLAAANPNRPVNVLTHCNAGWLATVDWGTATAAIYLAHQANIDLHIWVDETRPRSQGAALTAWELGHMGISHHLITDTCSGHLMQTGQVDLVITGADRVTATGDVCNKIGTYLVALAASDNQIPMYVATPSPTIDWSLSDGLSSIPIEQRSVEEVTHVWGCTKNGSIEQVRITPPQTSAINHAFDVTPSRLITGLITERGIVDANEDDLAHTFSECVVSTSP
jgi:methylthioribose-1-phosphate isomerase